MDQYDAATLNGPAAPPPPGVVPNFVDPPSRDYLVKTIYYVTLPLIVLATVGRLYTRIKFMRIFGADDYLAVISLLFVAAYGGTLHWLYDGPSGEHSYDVTLKSIMAENRNKGVLAASIVYRLGAMFTKLTILALYRRIFRPTNYVSIMIILGMVTIGVIYFVSAVLTLAFYIPRSADEIWGFIPEPRITYILRIASTIGVFGVVTDFYVLIIPMHLVLQLHLPVRKKVGVCGIFITGLFACACSLAATVYRFRFTSMPDPAWIAPIADGLVMLELNTGLLCGSLPVIVVLFRHLSKADSSLFMRRYFHSYLNKRRRASPVESELQPVSEDSKGPAKVQVHVTKPTMTTLKNFMRGGAAGRSHAGHEQIQSWASYGESVSDEYHAHLSPSPSGGRVVEQV